MVYDGADDGTRPPAFDYYLVNSVRFGGRLDMPAFGPLSYLLPGVKEGKLSDKITHTSKIYDGMKSDYWIYVPTQYDPNTPAALMVFQDGSGLPTGTANNPTLNVIDNLIAQKKIPGDDLRVSSILATSLIRPEPQLTNS